MTIQYFIVKERNLQLARLNDNQREQILADYHIGKSQNQLAFKYDVSPATINKLCKGIEPKYKEKVNTIVAIKSELACESEYQSECFDKEVNEQLRNRNLVFGVTQKALKKLEKMVDSVDNASDLKTIIDASDRASLTLKVNERFAKTENNNINAFQQVSEIKISDA